MEAFIIGITGGSGSGKTTFVNLLRDGLVDEDVAFISMDNYYKPRDDQFTDKEGVRNFDLPESLDHIKFMEDILKLKNGKKVIQLEYTFNDNSKPPKEIVINPAPVIVIEGLFIFHYLRVNEIIDLKIFIEAKENLKVIRRIKRDRIERNYPLDDVLYRYQHHVLPSFEKYILPYKSNADIIINNNKKGFDTGLDVIQGFISNQLKTSNGSL